MYREQIDNIREHDKKSVLDCLHELLIGSPSYNILIGLGKKDDQKLQDHQDNGLISVKYDAVGKCQVLQYIIT
jgi:hypothetical protein